MTLETVTNDLGQNDLTGLYKNILSMQGSTIRMICWTGDSLGEFQASLWNWHLLFSNSAALTLKTLIVLTCILSLANLNIRFPVMYFTLLLQWLLK